MRRCAFCPVVWHHRTIVADRMREEARSNRRYIRLELVSTSRPCEMHCISIPPPLSLYLFSITVLRFIPCRSIGTQSVHRYESRKQRMALFLKKGNSFLPAVAALILVIKDCGDTQPVNNKAPHLPLDPALDHFGASAFRVYRNGRVPLFIPSQGITRTRRTPGSQINRYCDRYGYFLVLTFPSQSRPLHTAV